MRLLQRISDQDIRLVGPFADDDVPAYAILSHRWENDPKQEVDYEDMMTGQGRDKAGYQKIMFCAEQAFQDQLQHFWVDSCCIKKSLDGEHQKAVKSMFNWYQRAQRCYVYLADVSANERKSPNQGEREWISSFERSQWFSRGWTLQELLAPPSVEFFSREGMKLGDKTSLQEYIHAVTGICREALWGRRLTTFTEKERFAWMERRKTTLEEDKVYALLGIFDVEIPIHYGQGWSSAYQTLRQAIDAQAQVMRDLFITHPYNDKKRIEHDKGGLLPGACNWISQNDEFQRWRTVPHHQSLWIRGDPGKGKTMLVCGIIDELEKTMSAQVLLSYFFCQATDERINNATAVLRGLLYMLIKQRPSLVNHIETQHAHAGRSLFEDANSWTALKDIFSRVLQDARLKDTVFIIDALDECTSGLQDLLDFIIHVSANSPNVKWLVSSRDWPTIEKPLSKAERMLGLHLELNAKSVSEGVGIYIRHKVDELAAEKDYDEKLKHDVLQHLLRNAGDTFLWVALVCKGLRAISRWNTRRRLVDFPSGLDALYEQMIDQIDRSDDKDFCKAILATCALTYRPISLSELGILANLPRDLSQDFEFLESIVRQSGSFLTIREGISDDKFVSFVHQSAKEYIVANACRAMNVVTMAEEHLRLAQRSIQRLSEPEVLKEDLFGIKRPGARRSEFVTAYVASRLKPGVSYTASYWAHHFLASKHNLSDDDFVHKFWQRHLLPWLEALSWLNQLSSGINVIRQLQTMASGPRLRPFLDDIFRFLLHNGQVIDDAPLQIYHSALYFAPKEGTIGQSFRHCASDYFSLLSDVHPSRSKERQTLGAHQGGVASVAFSPDGSFLASGSGDKTVRLWDAATGEELRIFAGHELRVTSVAFSPDGSLVASGSWDGTARLWDTFIGKEKYKLEGHNDFVKSVAFAPDGLCLASTSADLTVRLWDVSAGKEVQKLVVLMSVVSPLDGYRFVLAPTDFESHPWETAIVEKARRIQDLKLLISSVTFSPDGSLMAYGTGIRLTLRRHETTGMAGGEFEGFISHMIFSPNERYRRESVDVKSVSGCVRLWDMSKGEEVQILHIPEGMVISVAFSWDGSQVAIGSDAGVVGLWNVSAGTEIRKFEAAQAPIQGPIMDVTFSPDGSRVAFADGMVRLYSTSTGKEVQKLSGHKSLASSVVFSPDGSQVAAGYSSGLVLQWDVSVGADMQWPRQFDGVNVTTLIFSWDGSRVLSGHTDLSVRLWDASTAKELRQLECSRGYDAGGPALAFSSDGSLAATGSRMRVHLWNATTGEEVQKLEGHKLDVLSVAFSQDGSHVVSGSYDHTIRIWNASTGKQVKRILTASPVRGRLNFSRDNSRIETESGDFDTGIVTILVPLERPETSPNIIQLSGSWIRIRDQDILRLPLEYRNQIWKAGGDTLVIGDSRGNISFFKAK